MQGISLWSQVQAKSSTTQRLQRGLLGLVMGLLPMLGQAQNSISCSDEEKFARQAYPTEDIRKRFEHFIKRMSTADLKKQRMQESTGVNKYATSALWECLADAELLRRGVTMPQSTWINPYAQNVNQDQTLSDDPKGRGRSARGG
jgi:hypothetical protein